MRGLPAEEGDTYAMTRVLMMAIAFLAGASFAPADPFFAAGQDPKPAGKVWNRVDNMSDEFDGTSLDRTKWQDEPIANGWVWSGRPPGLFKAGNVRVKAGKMRVTVGKLSEPVVSRGNTFTHQGAIVRSLHPGRVGWYFECRMKANKTIMSSTFWLMTKNDGKKKLELDIQECVGRTTAATEEWGRRWDRVFHSNAIHRENRFNPESVQLQAQTKLATRNSERYFVYGAWWKSPDEIRFYLDGKHAHTIRPKVGWDVPAYIQMAIEIYDWNPIPVDGGLVESGTWDERTTQYDWVRTWKLDNPGVAPADAAGLPTRPLVKANPILFVVRRQYKNEHGTEATMYQTGEINTQCFQGGSALKLLDVAGGKVATILASPAGVIRDPEVHFDGRKILFSMRRDIDDDYHLYEINVDGSGLKQLTFAARVSDIQPIYLPDGSIAFSSTRDPKYIPCQRHLMANLFKMNGDGSNIHQIGYNTQFEGRASLMPDGRILYTRWEYVDKHFASAYGLWTVNPDGTDHALYYGGYAWQPGPIVDARMIPGTENFIAVFTAVHELGWGAVVMADRSRGLDGTKPILKSWPADISAFMSRWNFEERIGNGYDSFRGIKVKYEDPYPLSGDLFLCSRQTAPRKHVGIFAVDTSGNETLLHSEEPGCFDPMPVVSRRRPPIIPSRSDFSKTHGAFYVQNVYIGEFMDRVKPGTVKYLRIVEAPSKRAFPKRGVGDWSPPGSGDSHHPVALNWNHYNNKRVLGTVPVEEDGSAYFEVPACRFVYFQLLGKDKEMIHSMRSGTMLQPGEVMGCVGCHEYRSGPLQGKAPIALGRRPSQLGGWYGLPRKFSYAEEVQPVLDRYCVKCHDHGKDAEKINLSGDKGIVFNHSYTTFMRLSPAAWKRRAPGTKKPLVSSVGAGPVKVIPPYSWGSHQSRLIDMLKAGHPASDGKARVTLDEESLNRIVTWIDLNCPYSPSHVTCYGNNTVGRSPLDHKDLAELGKLVLQSPNGKQYGWSRVNEYTCGQIGSIMAKHGSPVSFTRPEKSLCLTGFDSRQAPGYLGALALIRKGAQNLASHPRCDMPHFTPCEADRARLDHLARRQEVEQRNREAIVRGDRLYDRQFSRQDN